MVSSLTSVRLWSQQAALNAFRDPSDSRASMSSSGSGASSPSLSDILFSNDGNDDDGFGGYQDANLSALIASLQQVNGGTADTDGEGDEGDMSSKAFMKALRDKLEGLKDSPETAAMAEKMLKAIDDGTLTVTNAVAGEKVTAWDPTDSKQISAAKESVDKADWSNFLKGVLARDSDGKFVRNADSSYIEKTGGANSYFGMVGDAYYYLSWTTPPATQAPATKPAAGAK